MTHWLSVLVVSFIYIQENALSLRLLEVKVPNYVLRNTKALLQCIYDLEGESLYSIKWYKDGNEFYRYLPREIPSEQIYMLPGVLVDLENSNDTVVTLANASPYTAGTFRCEVSGEAPSFQTVTDQGIMVVASFPDQEFPKMNGTRPRYQIGEWVHINCTAGRSKPAPQLKWFINEEPYIHKHSEMFTRKYDTIIDARDGMETSTLSLQFIVKQKHYQTGYIKLKCIASLSDLYERSFEETIDIDRHQKTPVLGLRVYTSNSRTDPDQGNKANSIASPIPSIFLLVAAALLTKYEYGSWDALKPIYFKKKKQPALLSSQSKYLLYNDMESKHIHYIHFNESYSAR